MLNFLPKKKVDASKLGESELWSTYFNPLLTAILSKPKDNILLRWTNKAAENFLSKRPDAIISDFNNNGQCLAYGEGKLGSAKDKATDADKIKLAMFTQRTINIDNKQNVLSFFIKDFKIEFFVTSLENEHVYVMKTLGEVGLPKCLDELPTFFNMKTVNDLLQISKYFWEESSQNLSESHMKWKKTVDYQQYLLKTK